MLRAALLLPLLAVGLASFIFVRVHADDGAALLARQQSAQALTRGAVDRVVRAAPDPASGERGTSADCVPLGGVTLMNPWRCAIQYPTGRSVQWTVTISAGGSYVGNDQVLRYRGQTLHEGGQITGCCIAVP